MSRLYKTQAGDEDLIMLAACSAGELLPQNPDLPADVFTSCLTTPIQMVAKEPYISAKEHYISAREPYISTQEPCVSGKEPYISATKPYISAQEPCLSAKEPYVSAKNQIFLPISLRRVSQPTSKWLQKSPIYPQKSPTYPQNPPMNPQ